jgi:4-alpha-glucanotransferase
MSVDSSYKQTGVLLHITSLPSDFGIGDLGKEAYRFIDYLADNKHTYWQVLPLNYPGFGDSPYNAISTFAGNPLLIDPVKLFEQGFLSKSDLGFAKLPNQGSVDFKNTAITKDRLFRNAYQKFKNSEEFENLYLYLHQESYWLKAFSVFSYYKDMYKTANWQSWKTKQKFYTEGMFNHLFETNKDDLMYYMFLQYVFDTQLNDLKAYAAHKGIKIIGDMPIYVSHDSCDVWSNPHLFELDESGKSLLVSGVPPDAFSDSGQLWGNPLYRWDNMQADDYNWWKQRLKKVFKYADRLRLDHFIGYVNYWVVNADDDTAVNGKWVDGPKRAFFDTIIQEFPKESFIAEDLGILTDEVNNIRDDYGFPGMIILQFCFQDDKNDVLSFPKDRIIFTGTHDNHTTRGWFLENQNLSNNNNDFMESYLHKVGMLKTSEKLAEHNVSELMIKLALASPCHIAIIPMQDILGLDDRTRMNIPGEAEGNWKWRIIPTEVID